MPSPIGYIISAWRLRAHAVAEAHHHAGHRHRSSREIGDATAAARGSNPIPASSKLPLCAEAEANNRAAQAPSPRRLRRSAESALEMNAEMA